MDKLTDKINILGVNVSCLKRNDIENIIKDALATKRQLFLTTPNPEIVLHANKDEEMHYILNRSHLSIPDGIGLKFAAWLLGKNIDRWPGSEITTWLLKIAEKENLKIAVFAWKNGLSTHQEIDNSLKQKFPKLQYIVEAIDREWSLPYYQNINIFQPDIVFVALGNPYQEKFIYQNVLKLNFVKIAIGVGGSFDYITDKIKVAPIIFRKFGFEWFWRLLNINNFSFAKKRFMRIFKAVIIFPIKYLKWLIINPLLYRQNVACLMFKKNDGKYEVLALECIDESGFYQLPQGGRDGETLQVAGTRELHEETGTFNFIPVATFNNVHKYKFEKKIDRDFRNYQGQNQGLFIAKFTGRDSDIQTNYWEFRSWKWIDINHLPEKVHPVRREATKKFIKLFDNEPR